MRTSDWYKGMIAKKGMKREMLYKRLLSDAAKIKNLDAELKRLAKGMKKSRRLEKEQEACGRTRSFTADPALDLNGRN